MKWNSHQSLGMDKSVSSCFISCLSFWTKTTSNEVLTHCWIRGMKQWASIFRSHLNPAGDPSKSHQRASITIIVRFQIDSNLYWPFHVFLDTEHLEVVYYSAFLGMLWDFADCLQAKLAVLPESTVGNCISNLWFHRPLHNSLSCAPGVSKEG